MDLFKNKYRIRTTRLPGYDYSNPGYYFITICSKNNFPIFGNFKKGNIHLSEIGNIVKKEYLRTEIIRKNVLLGEWILMPNHLHGIIILTDPKEKDTVEARRGVSHNMNSDELRHATGISIEHNVQHKNSVFAKPVPDSLSMIVSHFKASVTRKCRKIGFQGSIWQSNYFEHIIRNDTSLKKIREYIRSNPSKWKSDEYFTI
jgi:REP element-mobilizing transposase RayT